MKLLDVEKKLCLLYGDTKGTEAYGRLQQMLNEFQKKGDQLAEKNWLTEKDIMLITYANTILEEGSTPLEALTDFLAEYAQNLFSAVHILPFYPYSSDDGFSVIDYWRVDDKLGTWENVASLARNFDLMFDAVINHISAKSEWFQKYVWGDPRYEEFFIECDPSVDLSLVTRPRALPLLTPVATARGKKHVWTTFSDDQVDLNYRNENVLLKMVELLLFYVNKGARYIRLDAVGYLWKEIGTSCIHLPQTHRIIQIFRSVLDKVAPGTILITETNVPHEDNISYFGNGFNEAHLVYQFPLPPLALYTLLAGDSSKLTSWAASLETCSDQTSFFNFLASHDGIGLVPAQGILNEAELNLLLKKTKERGGSISYKQNRDGSLSPYELNISYVSALSAPEEDVEVKAARFLAAQAILLTLQGVPGIYLHSLLGSENFQAGVERSGNKRRINRERLNRENLEKELNDPSSLRHLIFRGYRNLLEIRRKYGAFHPNSPQCLLDLGKEIFAVMRGQGGGAILCLINVTASVQKRMVDYRKLGLPPQATELLTGSNVSLEHCLKLAPYQVLWLKNDAAKLQA